MTIKMIDNGFLVEFYRMHSEHTVFCKTVEEVLKVVKVYYTPEQETGH